MRLKIKEKAKPVKKGKSSTHKPSFLSEQIAKRKPKPILKPKRNQEVSRCFFETYDKNTGIFYIGNGLYSVSFEYSDISFAKADKEAQEGIFLQWVSYLHSFNENCHIQVTNASKPMTQQTYSIRFGFDETREGSNQEVAKEFNQLIQTTVSTKRELLETKRYITITQRARDFEEAKDFFIGIQKRTSDKFTELKSSIRRLSYNERLEFIYDIFHCEKNNQIQSVGIEELAKQEGVSIHDYLSPKEAISFKDSDYIELEEHRFLRCLYVTTLPSSVTPRFYNKLTSLSNINMYTTLNIQPTNPAKAIKNITRKISGLKTERLAKVKRAAKNGYDYEMVKDEKLETELKDAQQWLVDYQTKNQRLFMNNILVCIVADSFEELETHTQSVKTLASEFVRGMEVMKWLQLEGLVNTLPFGHNTLYAQRGLSSEATAINVPFNSKDIMHDNGLFFGMNLISQNGVYIDRKRLANGNGCVLGTSGGGKSFDVKMQVEQIRLRYPEDDIIIVDPQNEYWKLIEDEKGQTIHISTTADTYMNPFDIEEGFGANEIKQKVEFTQALVESMMDSEGGLSGKKKSYVDRCTRNIYNDYIESDFHESKKPSLKRFYENLRKQEEQEARDIAEVLERYVEGTLDIFSQETNVDIHNPLVNFEISELNESMQTTGYLVILEHIKSRIKENNHRGKNTWVFIDEFHILLENEFSANYIAVLYKTARKFGGIPTILTQNITDVLSNPYGVKILGNSEFAVLLKQKYADMKLLQEIFKISEQEAEYAQDAPAGQKLVIYGKDIIPCRLEVPKDFHIYDICNTDAMVTAR